jgi:enterochelin esterase-like enzyme
VTRRERQPYRVPLWIDAGRSDPFLAADRTFAAALRRRGEHVHLQEWDGGHEGRYWQRHMARYLRFYADALADCGRAG